MRKRVRRCGSWFGFGSIQPLRSWMVLTLVAVGTVAGAHAGKECCAPALAAPPTGWLQLRSTAYAFQSVDAYGVEQDRLGGYQEFDGAVTGFGGGRFALRGAGRFADDLALKEEVTDRSRLYTGHLEARPTARMTARLGRQFIQEGPTGLTLDGLWISARPDPRCEIRLWGGTQAPLDHAFELSNLDETAAWGLRLATIPSRALRVSGSYAYRERDGLIASRPLGLEAQLARVPGLPTLRATARLAYDLEREEWARAEALAQWRPGPNLPVVALQVVDRRPTIDAASYFARFTESEHRQLGRATVRYEHSCGFGVEAEYAGTFVEERSSTRIGGALVMPIGLVGYSMRIGDAGEENRWYGDVAMQASPWLRLEGGAALLTYALMADAPESEERDLTTAYARARLAARDGMDVTVEVQNVTNPYLEQDVRFLAGLDLTAGRGASRFGLQPGGWLR
jgi:hypothetical protein